MNANDCWSCFDTGVALGASSKVAPVERNTLRSYLDELNRYDQNITNWSQNVAAANKGQQYLEHFPAFKREKITAHMSTRSASNGGQKIVKYSNFNCSCTFFIQKRCKLHFHLPVQDQKTSPRSGPTFTLMAGKSQQRKIVATIFARMASRNNYPLHLCKPKWSRKLALIGRKRWVSVRRRGSKCSNRASRSALSSSKQFRWREILSVKATTQCSLQMANRSSWWTRQFVFTSFYSTDWKRTVTEAYKAVHKPCNKLTRCIQRRVIVTTCFSGNFGCTIRTARFQPTLPALLVTY